MPTGQAIINGALTALGILEQGGSPSYADAVDSLAELNGMWEAWGIDDGLVWTILSASYPLSANTPSYTIGPGAVFDAPRPARIHHAHLLTTLAGRTIRREMQIISKGEYDAHGDQATAGAMPEEIYADYNVDANGFATVYLYPAPSVPAAQQLELDTSVPFTAWTLTDNYQIPYGYQDALQYALAWRLIPRFGVAVAQQVAELIRELGQKSEARIVAANTLNRLKPILPQGPPAQGNSPITTQGMAGFQGLQPKG